MVRLSEINGQNGRQSDLSQRHKTWTVTYRVFSRMSAYALSRISDRGRECLLSGYEAPLLCVDLEGKSAVMLLLEPPLMRGRSCAV